MRDRTLGVILTVIVILLFGIPGYSLYVPWVIQFPFSTVY